MLKLPARILLAVGSLALPAPPAQAAPDNTLGMALLSATVDNSTPPNIARGSGAVSASRPGVAQNTTGYADVVFDRDVSNCTCTASVGAFAAIDFGAGNFVATATCPYTANTVRVITSNDGVAANFAFHLIVFCPK